MGFSLTKIFNWLKPKQPAPAAPATPPKPPLLDLPNLYGKTEFEIMQSIGEQLKNGALVKGSKALHMVCKQGWLDAARQLIAAGADVNERLSSLYIYRTTPFMSAAASGNPALMEELLKHGADAQAVDDQKHNAAYHFLSDYSYREELRTPEGQENDKKAFQILLDQKLELEPILEHYIHNHRRHLAVQMPNVQKALDFEKAVREKNYDLVDSMLWQGINPDINADMSGQAALSIAAGNNDIRMMGILMGAGADPKRWSSHFDALHSAAAAGAQEAFEKLVGAGVETEGERYAYDRYPDTTIIEVAAACKSNPGMKSFVEGILARKDEVRAEYEYTKDKFLHAYAHVEVAVSHDVSVHKPIQFKRRGPSA